MSLTGMVTDSYVVGVPKDYRVRRYSNYLKDEMEYSYGRMVNGQYHKISGGYSTWTAAAMALKREFGIDK